MPNTALVSGRSPSGRTDRAVAFALPREEWRLLDALARAHERDPYQHARWIVREALRAHKAEQDAS